MTEFLEKVHPFITGDDKYVQRFSLHALEDDVLANDETFKLLLEAHERAKERNLIASARNYQLTETGFAALVNQYKITKKNDRDMIWLNSLLHKCETSLIIKFRQQLEGYVPDEWLNAVCNLPNLSEKELYELWADIANDLEENGYSDEKFSLGKRILKQIIEIGAIEDWEVRNSIHNEMQEALFSYDGIFNVFVAGEMGLTSLIEPIASLLTRDEDVLLDEVFLTLVKFGTDEVVKEVEKYITQSDIYAVDILAKIKSPLAEKGLIHGFDKVDDVTTKTLIAEALCEQLSVKAIPRIEQLLEDGYDATFSELEESLYANYIINGIEHPDLHDLRAFLEEREKQFNKDMKKSASSNPFFSQPVKSTKVGRNEPCPCGSGKKYKKCCGN